MSIRLRVVLVTVVVAAAVLPGSADEVDAKKGAEEQKALFRETMTLVGEAEQRFVRQQYGEALDRVRSASANMDRLEGVFKERTPRVNLAFSRLTCASMLLSMGLPDEALKSARQSEGMYDALIADKLIGNEGPLEARAAGYTHPHHLECLKLLGTLYVYLGDLERALPYCERVASAETAAYALTKRLKTKGKEFPYPPLGDALHELGVVLVYLGKHGKGGEHLRVAARVRQQAWDDHQARTKALGGREDQNPLVDNLVNPARDLAATVLHLGMAYEGLNRPAEALAHYERAVALFRKAFPKGGGTLVAALTYVAGFHTRAGKLDQAEKAYAAAAAVTARSFPAEQFPDGHPSLANLELVTGQVLIARGQHAEALPHLRRAFDSLQKHIERFAGALSVSEAITYQNELPAVRDHLLTALGHLPRSDQQAYDVVWRSKATVTRILRTRHFAVRAELKNKDSKARPVWNELITVRRRLSRVLGEPGEDRERHQRLLTALTERKEKLEGQLAALVPEAVRQQKLARSTPAELRDRLPAGSAFVDLLRYDTGAPRQPHYVAFVLTRDQPAKRVELGAARTIEQALSAWRHALAEGGDHPEAARVLRQRLWEPLARALPPKTDTVYLAPDGELTLLPWAALPGAKANEVLLHDYEGGLAVIQDGQFLLEQLLQPTPSEKGFRHFLAVGHVNYNPPRTPAGKDAAFKPLDGTAVELADLEGVAKDWGPVVLRGDDATARRLLEELPKADAVHVATHGYYNLTGLLQEQRQQQALLRSWEFRSGSTSLFGRGRRSPLAYVGLACAGANEPARAPEGGLVSGEMLLDLPLERTRLVVLSACDTGVGVVRGRAEGVQSLQSAFHLAGAGNVVATLWAIPDQKDTTPALMKAFYAELSRGTPPLKALRAAQLYLYTSGPKTVVALKRSAPTFKGGVGPTAEPPSKDPKESTGSTRWAWGAFVLSGAGR